MRITSEPGPYIFFYVVGNNRSIGPLMAFCRTLAGYHEIIQQHIIMGQLMGIGCNGFSVDTKRRITIALWHITQDLIIGTVFFYNIEYMFDQGRFTNPFWQRFWLNTGPGRQLSSLKPG